MSELSFKAREVIDAARGGDQLPPETRARTRAALIAGLSSGAAVASTSAAAASVPYAKFLILASKLVIAIAVLGAAVGTTTWIVMHSRSQHQVVSISRAFPTQPSIVSPPVVIQRHNDTTPPQIQLPSIVTTPDLSTEPSVHTRARTHAAAHTHASIAPTVDPPAVAPVTNGGLAGELQLLRASRAALDSGQAQHALALLDQHAREYPAGALREERMATRVLVLCTLGRRADARSAAVDFLRVSPRSLHSDRLRASCVGADLFSPTNTPGH